MREGMRVIREDMMCQLESDDEGEDLLEDPDELSDGEVFEWWDKLECMSPSGEEGDAFCPKCDE